MITMGAGVIISYFTQSDTDSKVNPDAISPIVHWMSEKCQRSTKYDKTHEMQVKEAEALMSQTQIVEKTNT